MKFTGKSPSSLRARLLQLVALASLPVLLMMFYAGMEQRRSVEDEARNNVLEIARFAAENHRHLLHEARGIVSMVASLPIAATPDSQRCPILLGALVSHNDTFANIGVIGPDGNLACSGMSAHTPLYMGDRPYIRAILDGSAMNTQYEVDNIVAGPTLILAMPALMAAGSKYAVYAAARIGWFDGLITDASVPADASLTIVDPERRVLAQYPNGEEWQGQFAPDLPVFRELSARDEGTVISNGLNGVRRLYAFARLEDRSDEHANPHAPYILVGLPMHDVLAGANAVFMRGLAVFLVAVAIALALAWFGSDVLVLRRLRTLLGATRRIAGGDLTVRTRLTDAPAEIMELSTTLDDMTRSLERRDREEQRHLARISRQNRVHRVLSGISGAILRIRDRNELLREACRIAVAEGQFVLAWIGLTDGARLVISAADGECAAPLAGLAVPLVQNPAPPYSIAALQGRTVVLNEPAEIASGPEVRSAVEYGSCVMLPLHIEDRTVGVFALYAAERGFFDDEELHLLDTLAADTGFGLGYIEQTRQLSYIANYDPTTGLPNRTLFEDRLDQIVKHRSPQRPAAVAVLSLANARRIGDVLGRPVVDRVIVALARRLAEAINRADTLAFLGPAEFGLLISDVDGREDAAVRVHALLSRLPEFLDVDDEPVVLHLHAGVAVFPADAPEGETLLRNAELALHEVDGKPGAQVRVYSPQTNVQARERLALERELHFAAERGELALAYQPIVDLRSDRVVGVEALLRWKHPLLGVVSPDRFVPLAEKTGLILSIGDWVLEAASAQAAAWHACGYRVRVAANMSVLQLRQHDIEARIHSAIKRTGLDPRTIPLGLELTETDVMENMDQAEGTLRRLREMGIFVHIDDFGTGHSSLAYLRRLPIDTLKIDRSFVTDLDGANEAREVVRAIISLAHNLHLRVIAEGVENEDQLSILRDLECDAVQGFLFGRPQTAEMVESLFERAGASRRSSQTETRP